MADVNRPPVRPRRQGASSGREHCRDDRGQLFLIGALSLAVLFVGFALLLNTAIYTENLATRNTDPGTDPSISYQAAAEDAARAILIRENQNGTTTSQTERTEWFESEIGAWSDSAGLHAARRARVASVSVSSTPGTRFEQTNNSRAFTDRNASANWPLSTSPGRVGAAQLTVSRDSLAETNRSIALGYVGGVEPFAIEFTDGDSSDTWHVYVYDNSSSGTDDVTVLVHDGASAQECTPHTGPAATIDLLNGTINGTSCPAFSLLDVEDEDVELRFENGDEAAGTYRITAATDADYTNNVYEDEGSDDGAAYATAVIYEANVTITYESTDVFYQTTVHLASEEVR